MDDLTLEYLIAAKLKQAEATDYSIPIQDLLSMGQVVGQAVLDVIRSTSTVTVDCAIDMFQQAGQTTVLRASDNKLVVLSPWMPNSSYLVFTQIEGDTSSLRSYYYNRTAATFNVKLSANAPEGGTIVNWLITYAGTTFGYGKGSGKIA